MKYFVAIFVQLKAGKCLDSHCNVMCVDVGELLLSALRASPDVTLFLFFRSRAADGAANLHTCTCTHTQTHRERERETHKITGVMQFIPIQNII